MDQNVKRIYMALGAVCILFGAALLGIAAYGLFLKEDTQQPWIYVRPAWPDQSAVAGEDQAPDLGSAALGSEPYRLVIEKLSVDAPVAAFGLDENAIPVVPYEPDLVAWYNFSAYPGTGENAVFAGHKTWRGEAVFYDLESLSAGDEIILRAEDGREIVYRVSEMHKVDPNDPSALQWLHSTGRDSITLITCGGDRFFTDTPAGADYTHRVVVRAERSDDVASAQAGG